MIHSCSHGAYAQQGQGQEPVVAAVQARARLLAEDHGHRGASAHFASGAAAPQATPEARSNKLTQWHLAVQVEEHIARLGKKGLRPSAIGVILRDQHGIAQVRLCITGRQGQQVAMCCVKAVLATAPAPPHNF